jgi:hypothetical protein
LPFTPEGLCFPHHSLGEYLAALALRKTRLSLILDYIFLPGTRIPNTSWKSAIGFLAEVHFTVRRYFANHHPELALQSAFSALTAAEKAAIGQSLYKRLCARGEPLFRHPEISASRLAQCLKTYCLNELESDARTATDPIVASNAFLLLGEANQQSALPLATSTALDRNMDIPVRQARVSCRRTARYGGADLKTDCFGRSWCFSRMLVAIGIAGGRGCNTRGQ